MRKVECCRCETMIRVRWYADENDEIHLCPSCGTAQVLVSDWTGRDEVTDDSFVEVEETWIEEKP